jgi:anti-sigma regulatory factor (Ser/Thr protein kinase)
VAVGRFTHEALYYGTDEELVAAAVPFLRAGLESGERAVLVCTERNATLLSEALDDKRVRLEPHAEVYTRTASAIAAYQRLMARELADGTSRVRAIGEVPFGQRPVEWTEWSRFEAVCNVALARYPLWSLCVYDTRQLPGQVLDAGEQTHPRLYPGRESRRYREPAEFVRAVPAGPLPVEAATPVFAVQQPTDLVELRAGLLATLARSGLPERTATDLVFAASELTTNAMRHGRPPVRVRLWSTTDQSVCTVTDAGPGFDDPLAGYVPAHGGDMSRGGMGLWLARQLCDQVTMAQAPEGFTVRMVVTH